MDQSVVERKPSYGASANYLSGEGSVYFASQRRTGELGAAWNEYLWQPYVSDDNRVLDFGCGGGALLERLPGSERVGVEINPAARAEAQSRGLKVVGSLEELTEDTEQFSRIISSHALEHVPNPFEALLLLRTLLANDGRLILLLPLDDWRAPWNRHYTSEDPHHHLYAWTPQLLGNLLEEAGFVPERVEVITDCMLTRPAPLLLRFPLRMRRQVGRLVSILFRRRQLLAVARRESVPSPIRDEML